MNIALIWLILVPMLIAMALWLPFRDRKDSWQLPAIFAGVGIALVFVVFVVAKGTQTADIEIINGKITEKQRIHDTYEQSYPCNCRSVSSGSGQNATSTTVCDTCYETHYTVEFKCDSTIGSYQIDKEDSTLRSVYKIPDHPRWTVIRAGDPVSKSHRYQNYVQAVPESLFKPAPAVLKAKFAGLIPTYPDQIYDLYKVNRFLSPGHSVPDAALWNNDISMMLRDLGPQKQVNAIVVIAKTDDLDYEYALRDAWEGVNKNDVVLLIGSKEYPKIDYVRVLTWSKSEIFKIELRDNVEALGVIQREPIMGLLQAQIAKNFDRRHMRDFEYLQAEIDPPTWVIVLLLAVLGAAGGFVYYKTSQAIGRTSSMNSKYRAMADRLTKRR